MDKPKFIRVNGRIIPIGSKEREKKRTREDVAVGAATGLLSGAFFRRTNMNLVAGISSLVHGAKTSNERYRDHGFKKGISEDIKAGLMKSGATAAGFLAGLGGTLALNKLNKARKAAKMGKKVFTGKVVK